MKLPAPERLVRASCFLTLGALALMVWSLFDARPIPVITSMSLGQVLGTLSLGTFVVAVASDVLARARARRESTRPPA